MDVEQNGLGFRFHHFAGLLAFSAFLHPLAAACEERRAVCLDVFAIADRLSPSEDALAVGLSGQAGFDGVERREDLTRLSVRPGGRVAHCLDGRQSAVVSSNMRLHLSRQDS